MTTHLETSPANSDSQPPGGSVALHDDVVLPPTVTLPDCLALTRCFAVMPPLTGVEDDNRVVTVLEVMAQEEMSTVALHVDDLDRLGDLAPMFDQRLFFGVHGVRDTAQLERGLEAGAQFVLLVNADPTLVARGVERGVAVLPAALTPHEVQTAAALGAPAVQVVPADMLGGSYPQALFTLIGEVAVVARGGLGGWSAGKWFTAGAIACGFDDGLLGDALTGGNLAHLRDRCRTLLASRTS